MNPGDGFRALAIALGKALVALAGSLAAVLEAVMVCFAVGTIETGGVILYCWRCIVHAVYGETPPPYRSPRIVVTRSTPAQRWKPEPFVFDMPAWIDRSAPWD